MSTSSSPLQRNTEAAEGAALSSLFQPATTSTTTPSSGLVPILHPLPSQSFETTNSYHENLHSEPDDFSRRDLRGRRSPLGSFKKLSLSSTGTGAGDDLSMSTTQGAALLLLTLPCDAMHCIAGFLTTGDWSAMSLASRGANRACKSVFRRVRMHGFRCATEVVSAWARGEHADARELAALYIKNGVPIYAPSLGHSFHTLMWRMSREAREMEPPPSPPPASPTTTPPSDSDPPVSPTSPPPPPLDRFYSERYEARDRGGYFLSSLTYLQEKSLFWKYKRDDAEPRSRFYPPPSQAPSRAFLLWQLAPPHAAGGGPAPPPPHQRRPMVYRNQNTFRKAIEVRVHKHLAHQHLAGRPLYSEEDMNGLAEPISLSADFFHPVGDEVNKLAMEAAPRWEGEEGEGEMKDVEMMGPGPVGPGPVNMNSVSPVSPVGPANMSVPALIYPLPLDSITSDVALSFYNGTSPLEKGEVESLEMLRVRFDSYQKKLNGYLETGDVLAFNECLLDFWDECLPKTAGIHFFDKHTPVPRIAKLDSFLTEPCPKAIGIVQCEIERIRSPSSKRQSVKGRLFPTYEYRLFIRDRRSEGFSCQRRDTVLMTAKNRGKNHQGAGQNATSSKRGVNNYYLYMAENPTDPESPTELGRLQSNFIGTEFQIFSPSLLKSPQTSNPIISSESDNETDTEKWDHAPETTTPKPKRPLRRKKSTIQLPSFTTRTNRRAIAANEAESSNEQSSLHEEEDGAITYTANLLGNRPRVMDVCIPKINEDGSECEWRRYVKTCPRNEGNRMLSRFKQLQERLNTQEEEGREGDENQTDFGLLALQNRPPWWNIELGAFVLNFGGRVSVASVKNFQLCDRNDQDYIMLQFGRIQGRHSFTMDFQYPLTAVQAFAIAISSLQSKISLG